MRFPSWICPESTAQNEAGRFQADQESKHSYVGIFEMIIKLSAHRQSPPQEVLSERAPALFLSRHKPETAEHLRSPSSAAQRPELRWRGSGARATAARARPCISAAGSPKFKSFVHISDLAPSICVREVKLSSFCEPLSLFYERRGGSLLSD